MIYLVPGPGEPLGKGDIPDGCPNFRGFSKKPMIYIYPIVQ
jgi:hypothetical protein